MKITKLETLCLSRMHEPERQWITARYRTVKADCAVVLIHTDEGVTGIGEACAYGVPHIIAGWVDWYSSTLVGKDPLDPAIVPHPNDYNRGHDTAVAGIDCALWDLRGKIQGQRTANLLTENPVERVRVYASSGCRYDWSKNPHQLIDEALSYVDAGLTAMKFRIGTEWSWDGVTVDRFLGLVGELVQAVDGRMELMLDGNQRLSVEDALTIAKALDEWGFAWFEEPIKQENLEGYVLLNNSVEMPVTGGEQFTTLQRFRPYIEQNAYGIVQPDAGVCGITEALRIAEKAHEHGIGFCPHSWHNGLMAMANGHLVASLPNPSPAPFAGGRVGSVLEICMIQGPLQWGMLAEKPRIEDGFLILPEQPGLGVALTDNITEKFPYIEGHYAVTIDR